MPDTPALPATEPLVIDLHDKASLGEVAVAMKERKTFVLTTEDKQFNPLSHDPHSVETWLGALGGGALMTIGAGALGLAFLDREPTSKLGLLVAGGITMALTGGGILFSILIMRRRYSAVLRINAETKRFEWVLTPQA